MTLSKFYQSLSFATRIATLVLGGIAIPLATGCVWVTSNGRVIHVNGDKYVASGKVCVEATRGGEPVTGAAVLEISITAPMPNGYPYSDTFTETYILDSHGRACRTMNLPVAVRIKEIEATALLRHRGQTADGSLSDATDDSVTYSFEFSNRPGRRSSSDPSGEIRYFLGHSASAKADDSAKKLSDVQLKQGSASSESSATRPVRPAGVAN